MSYVGDYALGVTFYFPFETLFNNVLTSLAGTPSLAVYTDDNVVQFVTGLTLVADFDGIVGTHSVKVIATGGNGFASGSTYTVRIAAGTVGGQSAVGRIVGVFSIEKVSALRPTTAGRTLLVDANNRVDVGAWLGTAVTIVSGLPSVNVGALTAGVIAAATFAANALDAVWATAARTLTAFGFNVNVGSTSVGALDAGSFTSAAEKAFADALLARDVVGGGDAVAGGRVADALACGLLDLTIAAGVMTVKHPISGATILTRTLHRTAGLDAIDSSVP